MSKRMLGVIAILLVFSVAAISLNSSTQPAQAASFQAASGVATLSATAAATAEVQPFTLFSLNSGTQEQYLTIPNMNNRMVREYLEYRPYTSILQFRKEIGKYVDASQVAEWEKYVYVPVKVDSTDAATLKQIPGITDEIANSLIAGLPYASNEAFLTRLATYLPTEQVIYAANYLDGTVTIPTSILSATPAAAQSGSATAAATVQQ